MMKKQRRKQKRVTVSEHFKLNKAQHELDFFDAFTHYDTPLFIDPWSIRCGDDDFSVDCYQKLQSVFETLINLIKDKKEDEALDLLDNLHEPSETGLGYAKNSKDGAAVGREKSEKIYEALQKSKAVQSGLLTDLEDAALHIEGVSRDTVSDIVTNIIRYELIKYTQEQCNIYDIPMAETQTKTYWNEYDKDFVQSSSEPMLMIDGKKILLVPKRIIRKNLTINYTNFYRMGILEFEQARLLDARDSLCRTLRDKKGKKIGLAEPYKKTIEESGRFDLSRDLVLDYIDKYPELLTKYKDKKSSQHLLGTSNKDILKKQKRMVDLKKTVENRTAFFKTIKSGSLDAPKYHDHIYACLNIIFNEANAHNYLASPFMKEVPMNGGRKRIDITYQNRDDKGFFSRLNNYGGLICAKIFFECKNYTQDLKNPEYDQMHGRFNNRESTIGYIVCRGIKDKEKALKTCQDYLINGRGYIFVFTDEDIIKMLEAVIDKERDMLIDSILQEKMDELQSFSVK